MPLGCFSRPGIASAFVRTPLRPSHPGLHSPLGLCPYRSHVGSYCSFAVLSPSPRFLSHTLLPLGQQTFMPRAACGAFLTFTPSLPVWPHEPPLTCHTRQHHLSLPPWKVHLFTVDPRVSFFRLCHVLGSDFAPPRSYTDLLHTERAAVNFPPDGPFSDASRAPRGLVRVGRS